MRWLSLTVAIPFGIATGCNSNPFPDVQPMSPEVRKQFNTYCALCHGEDGRGQGVRSATLPVKPHDWTDMGWQKSISDEEIRKIIVNGGAKLGRSNDMPSFPHLEQTGQLDDFVNAVRSFAVFRDK